jgi:hypothetical protein
VQRQSQSIGRPQHSQAFVYFGNRAVESEKVAICGERQSTQNAFQRATAAKWDWLVMFQSCSIITFVDAITTAWEH